MVLLGVLLEELVAKLGAGLQARRLQNLPMTHIDNVLFGEDIYDI